MTQERLANLEAHARNAQSMSIQEKEKYGPRSAMLPPPSRSKCRMSLRITPETSPRI